LSNLVQSGCRTCKTWTEEQATDDMNLAEKYCLSFHWSLSALSGDTQLVLPANIYERIYATCVLFLAFVVSASYVGSITTSMTRLQIIASEQSSKLAALRRFLLDHNISRPLAVRVQRNAQHAMTEEKSKALESSVDLLKIISQPVLVEVHFEIHSRVLFNHPFMLAYSEVNPAGMRRVCHSAISMLSVHGKDVLFSDLEAVLWTKWTHRGTLRASTEARLLLLDAPKFQEVVSAFPSDHAAMYAEEYVLWLNRHSEEASDAGPSLQEACTMIDNAFGEMDSSEEDDWDDFDEDDEDDDGEEFAPGRSSQSSQAERRTASRTRLSSKRSSAPNRSRSTTSVVQRGWSWIQGASMSVSRRSTSSESSMSSRNLGSVASTTSSRADLDVCETQEEHKRGTSRSVSGRKKSQGGDRPRPHSQKVGGKKSTNGLRLTSLLPSPTVARSGGIFGHAFGLKDKSRSKSANHSRRQSGDDQVHPVTS